MRQPATGNRRPGNGMRDAEGLAPAASYRSNRNPATSSFILHPSSFRRGVTFIELMVVLSIMGVIVSGISALLFNSWQSQQTVVTQNDVQKWAQQAADGLADGLRQATTLTIGSTSYQVYYSEPRGACQFWLDGQQLMRSWDFPGDNGQKMVANWVTSLSLAYWKSDRGTTSPAAPVDANLVTISLTVSRDGYQAALNTWVKLRNKEYL